MAGTFSRQFCVTSVALSASKGCYLKGQKLGSSVEP